MRDAAFCYPCRLFGRASPGRSADTFTEKVFVIGNMQLVSQECCQNMIRHISTSSQCYCGVNTPKIPKRVLQ